MNVIPKWNCEPPVTQLRPVAGWRGIPKLEYLGMPRSGNQRSLKGEVWKKEILTFHKDFHDSYVNIICV